MLDPIRLLEPELSLSIVCPDGHIIKCPTMLLKEFTLDVNNLELCCEIKTPEMLETLGRGFLEWRQR